MNVLTWLNLVFAALGLVEGLINEPVGGPAVSAPPVLINIFGKTFSLVVSAQRTA